MKKAGYYKVSLAQAETGDWFSYTIPSLVVFSKTVPTSDQILKLIKSKKAFYEKEGSLMADRLTPYINLLSKSIPFVQIYEGIYKLNDSSYGVWYLVKMEVMEIECL